MNRSVLDADWFGNITGFRECDYETTRARLSVEGDQLVSTATGRRHGMGHLALRTLQDFRESTKTPAVRMTRTTVNCIAGDVRELHSQPIFAGALFQVASQFNLLEMVSPDVTPEVGVTGYVRDRTQGPACAIAAGAATIYRNYLVPVQGLSGQTADRQIDALAPLGECLAGMLNRPLETLWTMRNGYALCTAEGLAAMGHLLRQFRETSDARLDLLRGKLAIGLHRDVEVTDLPASVGHKVSQAFCSALPVSYTRIAPSVWEPFARVVLEAAYEATLLAAVEQTKGGGAATVLLTRLGGGAFGNDDDWIDDAVERALRAVEFCGLDVRLVSHGSVHPSLRAIRQRWH